MLAHATCFFLAAKDVRLCVVVDSSQASGVIFRACELDEKLNDRIRH
jgi:hypothetical protein